MAVAAPTYQPVAAGSRLYVSSAQPEGGYAAYWCSAASGLGQSADFAQCWQDQGGFFLFASYVPASAQDLAAYVQSMAQYWSPNGLTRVVWLDNDPALSSIYRRSQILTALPQDAADGPWRVIMPLTLSLGDYAVTIAPGCLLTPQTQNSAYGLSLSQSALTFIHGDYSQGAAANGMLAAAGIGIGAVAAPLRFAAQNPSFDGQLGVCLRYASPPDPEDEQAVLYNLAAQLSMPVLRLNQGSMTVPLVFDPCAPLDPARTYLSLIQSGGVQTPLDSAFSTTYGYAIKLTPGAGNADCRSARLVFCRSPIYAVEGDNLGQEMFFLAPDGQFLADVQAPFSVVERRRLAMSAESPPPPEQDHWMLGIAGSEYVALDVSYGSWAVFTSGMPAFVPTQNTADGALLTAAATTSYLSLAPAQASTDGLTYFAQPLQAPLFLEQGTLGTGFLNFHTMPAGALPSQGNLSAAARTCFPVGAYRWMKDAQGAAAQHLENAILAPMRRAAIAPPPQTKLLAAAADAQLAATPQGLLAQLSADGLSWNGVLFANLADGAQKLSFTPVGPDFTQALQSNQLFFVAADPTEFLRQSGPGTLQCTLDGWVFRLGPNSWRPADQENPTLVLFKYCNRTLLDLAAEPESWGWKKAAGNLTQTSSQLLAVLKAAETENPAFYRDVANNPMWNGVLFLNAPVDLNQMPPDLKFLAAGISPSAIFAHHVGFSVTPVQLADGAVVPGQTAAFALIDYRNSQSQSVSKTTNYGFLTSKLMIRFENAKIADFSARCQLMLNILLGSPLTKQDVEYGNNLVMDGTCQRVAGAPTYSFVLTGQNVYNAAHSALVTAEILTVRIKTSSSSLGDQVSAGFTISGRLRFLLQPTFDIFAYGADADGLDGFLAFGGLVVDMAFDMKTPLEQTFTAAESAIVLDMPASLARPNSPPARFPLRLNSLAMVVPDGDKTVQGPDQSGFVSISCPLEQSPLSPPWYGLIYDVDLGTLGALSGGIGLNMQVLAAWSPSLADENLKQYIGLKLASFVPGAGNLPLQGVLKLGFRGFNFIGTPADNPTEYQLWMRRFALSVLCWSFPPGNADLVLFGDPSDPKGSLGWYAAYDGKPGEAVKGLADDRQLLLAADAEIPISRAQAGSRRVVPAT